MPSASAAASASAAVIGAAGIAGSGAVGGAVGGASRGRRLAGRIARVTSPTATPGPDAAQSIQKMLVHKSFSSAGASTRRAEPRRRRA